MLAALACVDYVVIFDDASVAGLVERLLPDVLVKAAQYSLEQVVGYQIVAGYGGRVVAVPMKPAYSTSALIEKIRNLPRASGPPRNVGVRRQELGVRIANSPPPRHSNFLLLTPNF